MKRFFQWAGMIGFAVGMLWGCADSAYSVLERSEGSGQKSVDVQVPAEATATEMRQWASEIESQEKVAGKGFMVNFFRGDKRTSNLMASYTDGSFYETREEDRQEAAREGD